MKFFELLKLSFGNLWRRKLRTLLTILGVVIGTASIVVMISIGIGLNYSYMQTIENSPTLTLITVNNYGGSYGGGVMYVGDKPVDVSSEGESEIVLDRTAIDRFSSLEHVTSASPVYNLDIMARAGSYETWLYVQALDYEMLQALRLPVIEGEMPLPGDPLTLIAGRLTAYNFYNAGTGEYFYYDPSQPDMKPPVDLLNTSLFVTYDMNAYYEWQSSGEGEAPKKYMLDVATLIGDPDSDGYSDADYTIYADLSAVEELFQRVFKKSAWPNQALDSKGKPITPMVYNSAYVLVDDIDNVTAVQEELTAMGYQTSSNMDYLKAMQEQSASIQYVLGGIGAVALLVAAIGITNTMLMSIFERTKEIGIFKVLGCSLPNIRTMFLSEAALIGVGGGFLGLALSFLLSFLINILAGNISVIPAYLALTGVGIAVAVALVAGIVPAMRAMKLSPLEAIRSL